MAKKIPQYVQDRLSKEGFASSLRLLQLMREEGTVTQRGAAKSLGISYGTCSLHFQKLEYLGLIRRVDVQEHEGASGRSAVIWEIASQQNGFLVVFLKAGRMEAVLVDFDGAVRFRKREGFAGMESGDALLGRLEQMVDEALEVSRSTGCVARHVLVAVSGILDTETSEVVQFVHFPKLNGVNFETWVRSRFDLSCDCVPMGEVLYQGEIERFSPETRVMVVTWDLGVGMVAGVGGQVISCPEKLFLSEFGHLRLRANGRRCYCGRKGCLEAYVGGHAILDTLDDPSIQTLDELVAAVQAGHEAAREIVREAARLIGESLVWPLLVTGTEKLLFCGPLTELFPQVRDMLEAGLSTRFTADEIRAMGLGLVENSQAVLDAGAGEVAYRYFLSPAE